MGETIKEATIKLKLDSKEYEDSIRKLDKPAGEAGRKGGDEFSKAFAAGLKGAKSAVDGLFTSIKSGMSQLAGFNRVPGIADMAMGALRAEDAFRKLAFQVQMGTGKIVDFRSLMDQAKASAVKWGISVDDVAKSMTTMFEETGKIDVASGAIDQVAMVARATQMPVEQLANAGALLSKKFKVGTEDIGETLTMMLSAGERGGVKFDELTSKLGQMGAVAHNAGLEGKDGLAKMIGMMTIGEEGAKNLGRNIRTVDSLTQELGNKAQRTKLFAKLGIAPSVKADTFDDAIAEVMKKTGGDKGKLAAAFKGPELNLLVDLGKSYSKAFSDTQGDVKTKMAAGVAAYREQIDKAGKSAISYGDVQKRAASEMQTAQARMDQALEKMKASFMRPEVTNAIDKLADALPILADTVVSAVDLFAKHPIAGTAAMVGGAAGATAIKGFAGAGMNALTNGLINAYVRGGAMAGQAASAGLATGAPAAGTAMADAAGPVLAGAGVAGAAGTAIATAAAAAGLGLAAWQAKGLHDQGIQDVVDSKGNVVDQTTGENMWSRIRQEMRHSSLYAALNMSTPLAEGLGYLSGQKMNPLSDEEYNEQVDDRTGMVSGADYDAWAKKNGISTPSSPFKLKEDAPDYLASKYKEGPQGAGRSKEDAALFAQMMADRELKVRIVNPEAIRAGGGGGGGEPGPGYADRK